MQKMLRPQARQGLSWPRMRTILLIFLVAVSTYYLVSSGPTPRFNIVQYLHESPESPTEIPVDDDHDYDTLEDDEEDGSIMDGSVLIDQPQVLQEPQDLPSPAAEEKHEEAKPAAPENPPPPAEDKHEESSSSPQVSQEELELELPPNMNIASFEVELKLLEPWNLTMEELWDWKDPSDREDPDKVTEGYETDGKQRNNDQVSMLQHEKNMRKLWKYVYRNSSDWEDTNKIYGQTVTTLDSKDKRSEKLAKKLRPDPEATVDFAVDKPVRFNPYPEYNTNEWKKQGYAPHVACKGPFGDAIEDLLVFKGLPHDFPKPKLGSYSVLGMDPNICWERTTRLDSVGLKKQVKKVGDEIQTMNWDNVDWGNVQKRCLDLNAERFNMSRTPINEFTNLYNEAAKPESVLDQGKESKLREVDHISTTRHQGPRIRGRSPVDSGKKKNDKSHYKKEKRTAILLRSFTGKTYTANDKQNIRALISELSLRSGGEYEVFLLVHVKDKALHPFDDPETYRSVLTDFVPAEFHGITVLWNDQQVWDIYTKMTDDNEKSVHTAQWLSVQKFSHEHPQFDYIWNWEMDFRFTGHHYDLLDNIQKFATKQPRKGLWERNERWYIPEHHGDYDTTFRKSVEKRHGNDTVWGAPDLPFLRPVGPKPPVANPEEDDYKWGVGEEADYISVSPMFDPVDSNWIIGDQVWGYKDDNHKSRDLPRRTTIVTHSRLSKRLLDVMHIENQRGNHVASEMTPQTVALIHGLKAVYAPQPVFTDRNWSGEFLNDWFNPGPQGQSGGHGSPMGWGRERRYQGNTWYYRAEPPNRLYNNWMGWEDSGIGGEEWEKTHGRPCLPSIMLHPVKDTKPTEKGHATKFDLAFG